MVLNKKTVGRGFSLVELLVVAALMLVVFGGIFASFKYSLDLITQSRAKLSALTLANERLEYIHSLSYDAVGTVSGIPSGTIPQVSTTSLNTITFTETVLIEYIDDPADGVGAADSNGITTDYKRAKVTEGWTSRGVYHEIFLVSNIIPRSIETNVGGGTLRVNVFDANVQPLPGVDVHMWNTTGTTTVDVTRSTDATGVALFGGAPANSGYQISVSAPGYSTDKTYVATTSLPNPTTQPVAVRAADISTMNFFIDRVGSLALATLLSKTASSSVFTFATTSAIASSSAIAVRAGSLELASSSGVYATSGSAYLQTVVPATLVSWGTVTTVATTTAGTAFKISLYTGTSTCTLIPDSAIPGNSSGLTAPIINLSSLSVVTYPNLAVRVVLTSASTTASPQIGGVSVTYVASKTVAPSVPLAIHGAKTIGTLMDTSLVYKYATTVTSSVGGLATLNPLEWDSYSVAPTGYDVADACPANPVTVAPGTNATLELTLAANTANTLRVVVKTTGGTALPGGTVTLSRSGYTGTAVTTSCGQVFFSGLNSASDYDLSVAVPGYTTQTFSAVDVTGDIVQVVTF